MSKDAWRPSERRSNIPELFRRRLDSDADGEFIELGGSSLSANDVYMRSSLFAGFLNEVGIGKQERIAMLLENSQEALFGWTGSVCFGHVAVPINTAFKGQYLLHQLNDSGARIVLVASDLLPRLLAILDDLAAVEHVVVVAAAHRHLETPLNYDRELISPASRTRVHFHEWSDTMSGPSARAVEIQAQDIATIIYTGGTTGPSKGCMLSHNYHEVLARQIGVCWRRSQDDVVWTPLPMYHLNALVTAIVGTLIYGNRASISKRFSVSQFWSEITRVGATIASTLGTIAYLLAHDIDRPGSPRPPLEQQPSPLRLLAAAPLPVEVGELLKSRFNIETFSGAYGVTEASLVSWQPPGVINRANAAGVLNDEYFDVRIFDDTDNELGAGVDGEIVLRPRRPHVMFEGYWGDAEATVKTFRNLWYHTGDIGRIDADRYLYFVDRKADYLRRRGENISSFEIERILLSHGSLADVAVHAVRSPLTEDDLKITATIRSGAELTEPELFSWCVDELPYFALPRYIEFRAELPRSSLGRVLKRELREEGVTAGTWDVETSGIEYERR
ncbi:MAG TPA: AMP-binding protein [Chloroflexota bacterium]|nr:AMP-binding protein [Chloroflexota bacterium]